MPAPSRLQGQLRSARVNESLVFAPFIPPTFPSAGVRRRRGSLDPLLGGTSGVELVDALVAGTPSTRTADLLGAIQGGR